MKRLSGVRSLRPLRSLTLVMPKMPPDIWQSVKFRVAEMETMLTAMKELRRYEMAADARKILDETIKQGEKQLAALKKMAVN